MSTYAIGDIQGCRRSLAGLLRLIEFEPVNDRLWLVGDLINRGPDSLGVLRWARDLGDRAVVVLGNHELSLFATIAGVRRLRARDTMRDVLEAPDRDELVAWLVDRPLLHRAGEFVLVHAGLSPGWSVDAAEEAARAAERALRGDQHRALLKLVRVEAPERWDAAADGLERHAATLVQLTWLRAVRPDGSAMLGFSGPPEEAPAGCVPWWRHPARRSVDATVLFGHWAAFGHRIEPGIVALDSGCVWGGQLTAFRLEDGAVFQQPRIDP